MDGIVALRIACVHQGYELYGSDRSFAESVAAFRRAWPAAEIEVVLPRQGPIVTLLDGVASRIVYEPLWVLRRKNLPKLIATAPVTLTRAVFRSAARLRRNDLVYINTSVIIDHVLAARFFPGRVIQHIHEIPEGAARPVLRRLALWGRARLIFNSRATAEAFAAPPGYAADIVYNGLAGPEQWSPPGYDGTRPLRVLMLGRINRIKGQDILLAALKSLPAELRERLDVRIVGSAFEDPGLEAALRDSVADLGLSAQVRVEPFIDDPSPLYRWADIVTVPSVRPESLGRVAIEAMAFGRPPVASAIGGLREVVDDGITGWLVPPGDPAALAQVLGHVIRAPECLAPMAADGRARFEALFSEQGVADRLAAIVREMLSLKQSSDGLTTP